MDPNDKTNASDKTNAEQSAALSADDIRALIAEQVRSALDPKALASVLGGVVNAAVTNHMKRLDKPANADAQQAQQNAGANGNAAAQGASDPQLAKLQEKLARLEEESAAERKRASEIERRSQVDSARRALAERLAAKGITGVKQRAIIADFEQRGAFRLEEDGSPVLSITRARVKGSKATELQHRDLADGVDDWFQSDEAKEFLPAPTGGIAQPGRGGMKIRAGDAAPKFDLNSEDGAVNAALYALDNS